MCAYQVLIYNSITSSKESQHMRNKPPLLLLQRFPVYVVFWEVNLEKKKKKFNREK